MCARETRAARPWPLSWTPPSSLESPSLHSHGTPPRPRHFPLRVFSPSECRARREEQWTGSAWLRPLRSPGSRGAGRTPSPAPQPQPRSGLCTGGRRPSPYIQAWGEGRWAGAGDARAGALAGTSSAGWRQGQVAAGGRDGSGTRKKASDVPRGVPGRGMARPGAADSHWVCIRLPSWGRALEPSPARRTRRVAEGRAARQETETQAH